MTLTSGNTTYALVPANVTVPAGQSSANFTITTVAPTSRQACLITASYGGSAPFTNLYVEPPSPTVQSLSVTSPVTGGVANSCTATVTLSSPAFGSGITVTLSSSNTAVVNPPASVTVAAGQSSANANVPTTAVSTVTLVTLTASYNGSSPSQQVEVDPPKLTGLAFSPSSLTGGGNTTLTLTLNGPAPANISVPLTCSNGNALGSGSPPVPVGANFTEPISSGHTTASVTLLTSTVDYPTSVTVTANYNNGSSPLSTTLTLNPANLRVVDAWVAPTSVPMNPQVVLSFHWDSTTSDPQFQLQRNGVAVATVANTVNTATDTVTASSATVYSYTLYSVKSGGVIDQLLSEEEVEVDATGPVEDQTVDSRLDQRTAIQTYLDFCFGTGSYRGGLFAGFANDPARVGRSYALFLTQAPQVGTDFRMGTIAAYCTGLNVTAPNQNVSVSIGCQSIPPWTQGLCPVLVWDTQPVPSGFSAGGATNVQTISYSSGASPPGWIGWPLPDAIRIAATHTPSPLPLGIVWTETNESTTGWAYFAKTEYNVALAPTLIEVWDDPVVLSLSCSPTSFTFPSGTTGTLTLNGVGPGDTAAVALSMTATQGGNPFTGGTFLVGGGASGTLATNSPVTLNATGLNRTFTLTPSTGWTAHTNYIVKVTATYTPSNGGAATSATSTLTLTVP